MVLKILQWNARSLISNGQECKHFISTQCDKPDLLCVQETWLRPEWDFVLQGYTAVRRDRAEGRGGGVGIFVRTGVKYSVMNLGKEQESIRVKVWTEEDEVTIINYYNPCQKLSLDVLNQIGGEVRGKQIWCGDFNAHSTLWGSENTDANGTCIEEFIDKERLMCINNGSGTRYDSVRNTESAIDLTLVSPELASVTEWEVLNIVTVGSDHYPIMIRVGMKLGQEEVGGVRRWKFGSANWDEFQKVCKARCGEISRESMEDVDKFNAELVTAIIQSAEETIPKCGGSRKRRAVPWWDESCGEAVKERNRAFRRLKTLHSMETLIQYKRAQAGVRRTIRTAKRAYWRKYCGSIGRETKLPDIWGMIRRMNGIRGYREIPVLQGDGAVAVSSAEKAELLAQTLVKVHSSENLSDLAKQQRESTLASNPNVMVRKVATADSSDSKFSLFELKKAISSARQSAPGKDSVCYSMLVHMDDASLMVVLKLFNLIWVEGRIPKAWKESVIVPILKPGKDPSEASSYRPIALTS